MLVRLFSAVGHHPSRPSDETVPFYPFAQHLPYGFTKALALVFTWQAHHSMIIDNVNNFTHAYLHRKYRPFVDAKLTRRD